MPLELTDLGRIVQLAALLIQCAEQIQPTVEAPLQHSLWQLQPGCLEHVVGRIVGSLPALKAVLRERAVNVLRVAELAGFDEPRIELPAHLTGELSGNRAAGDVDQFLGKDGGRHLAVWSLYAADAKRAYKIEASSRSGLMMPGMSGGSPF